MLLTLNASGSNFGQISNPSATSWALGYSGSSTALGTAAALTWTGAGGVQIGAPTGGDKGAGTINAGGLFVNGVSVSTLAGFKAAQGQFNCTSGGCTPQSGATSISFTSRGSAGNYALSISGAGFTNAPTCTVSAVSSGTDARANMSKLQYLLHGYRRADMGQLRGLRLTKHSLLFVCRNLDNGRYTTNPAGVDSMVSSLR